MEIDTELGFKADALAMKLVGERHEKRELVNLVRWLILDKAEKANHFLANIGTNQIL